MSQEDRPQDREGVVKLMSVPLEERVSAPPSPMPRPLIAGLLALGFGAVFGVMGMFLLQYTSVVVSVSFIGAGGISAIMGAVLVMKFASDARFQPRPTVQSAISKASTQQHKD